MKTHWMKNPNKNYLGNWDLPEKKDLILTIKSAKWEIVKNPITKAESEKRIIRFNEDVKPLICNETNAKAIMKSTNKEFMEDSIGCKISLYKADYFDRKEKENIKVVRVRVDKIKIKLPELLPNTKNWQNVIIALKGNYTIEQIEKKYYISEQNKDLLNENI